jgi:hypothetical protein
MVLRVGDSAPGIEWKELSGETWVLDRPVRPVVLVFLRHLL